MDLPNIYQVIFRIGVIFAIVELLIMIAFGCIFIGFSPITETIVDVSLLTILATPLVYLTVIQPYISKINELMKSIKQQALTDYLTQLANRRACWDHLKRLVSYSKRHGIHSAILYIDLDKFKAINDIYGHAAGDFVLITTANRLRELVRQEDFLCRAGGDEFIISLPAIAKSSSKTIETSKYVADRILQSLTKPIPFENVLLNVGVSIGLSIVTPKSESVEKILEEADTAMYESKQSSTAKIIVFNQNNLQWV